MCPSATPEAINVTNLVDAIERAGENADWQGLTKKNKGVSFKTWSTVCMCIDLSTLVISPKSILKNETVDSKIKKEIIQAEIKAVQRAFEGVVASADFLGVYTL